MKVHGWGLSVSEDVGDATSASWSRKELSKREAATTALILSLYTSMLTYIVVVYAHAFRGGFILAFKIAGGAGGLTSADARAAVMMSAAGSISRQ